MDCSETGPQLVEVPTKKNLDTPAIPDNEPITEGEAPKGQIQNAASLDSTRRKAPKKRKALFSKKKPAAARQPKKGTYKTAHADADEQEHENGDDQEPVSKQAEKADQLSSEKESGDVPHEASMVLERPAIKRRIGKVLDDEDDFAFKRRKASTKDSITSPDTLPLTDISLQTGVTKREERNEQASDHVAESSNAGNQLVGDDPKPVSTQKSARTTVREQPVTRRHTRTRNPVVSSKEHVPRTNDETGRDSPTLRPEDQASYVVPRKGRKTTKTAGPPPEPPLPQVAETRKRTHSPCSHAGKGAPSDPVDHHCHPDAPPTPKSKSVGRGKNIMPLVQDISKQTRIPREIVQLSRASSPVDKTEPHSAIPTSEQEPVSVKCSPSNKAVAKTCRGRKVAAEVLDVASEHAVTSPAGKKPVARNRRTKKIADNSTIGPLSDILQDNMTNLDDRADDDCLAPKKASVTKSRQSKKIKQETVAKPAWEDSHILPVEETRTASKASRSRKPLAEQDANSSSPRKLAASTKPAISQTTSSDQIRRTKPNKRKDMTLDASKVSRKVVGQKSRTVTGKEEKEEEEDKVDDDDDALFAPISGAFSSRKYAQRNDKPTKSSRGQQGRELRDLDHVFTLLAAL